MIARKNIFLLIIFTLIFLLPINSKAQLSISLPEVSGSIGGTINVPITIGEVVEEDGLTSFQFNVQYDPDILFINGVTTTGTMIEGASVIVNPDFEPGKIRIAFAGVNPLVGSGTLIILKIDLLELGESPLNWDDARFFDGVGGDLPLDLTNGSVTVTDLAPPNLSSPTNGATGVTIAVMLRWLAAEFATGYNLQVARDAGFTQIQVQQNGIGSLSYALTGLNYETTYYWRVQSNSDNTTSDWSVAWSFTTESEPEDPEDPVPGKVSLNSPTNGTTLQLEEDENEVELSWNVAEGKVDAYQLDVAFDANFNDMVFTSNSLTNTNHLLTGLDNNKNYYWRVRAGNTTGWGSYSDTWNFTTLIVGVDEDHLNNNFVLNQNYPNPFNPSTNISYSIPEQSSVKLEIYDALGRNISTLVNVDQSSGYYIVEWQPKNLSSGIYLYRLEAVSATNQFVEVRSMLLVK